MNIIRRMAMHRMFIKNCLRAPLLCAVAAASWQVIVSDDNFSPLVASAYAQGSDSNNGGNGSQGVSGGIAEPHGSGSGGVTAGSGRTAGAGSSFGPGGVNQNRYGGKVNQPVTPPTDETKDIASNDRNDPRYIFDSKDWCADFSQLRLDGQARTKGKNMKRLKAAQRYLAPNFSAGRNTSGIHILADYQAELGKVKPDTDLAGIYLGLTSVESLNEKRLEEVNALLCVTATPKQMKKILRSAAQLQKKPSGRK